MRELKSHCKHGHAYVEENIYVSPKTGTRSCKTCTRKRVAARRKVADDLLRFGGNREIAIQRDGERCVSCSMTREEHLSKYGCDITVDHIDGKGAYTARDEKNNSLDNLQTLCMSCHGKKDNVRRKSYRKSKNPERIIAIRNDPRPNTVIGKELGVSNQYISAIKTGKRGISV